jgi:hypothetical protein
MSISWPPLLLSGSPSPLQSRYCRDANGNPPSSASGGAPLPLSLYCWRVWCEGTAKPNAPGRWGVQGAEPRSLRLARCTSLAVTCGVKPPRLPIVGAKSSATKHHNQRCRIMTPDLQAVLAIALFMGFILGFAVGYGGRAFISHRRHIAARRRSF